LCLVLNGTKIIILHYNQFLYKTCGISKKCLLDDGYILQNVEVMCTEMFSFVTIYEAKNPINQKVRELNEGTKCSI
jgi:hypothetical protein